MLKSIVKELGPVTFPEFTGERVYMLEIFKNKSLPLELKRWEPTVSQMLVDIEADGPIYLMIDQKVVMAGATHRRPGMHIDGFWVPANLTHNTPPYHKTDEDEIYPNETIVLASNVSACKALIGDWEGNIGKGGDVSHLQLPNLQEVIFKPNIAYAGNVTFLHESLPVPQEICRTVVRLNVPGHVIN